MFMFLREIGNRAAFTVSELLVVTAIVTSVSAASYVKVKDKSEELKCRHNLSQIASVLRMNEITDGTLPKAAFFPEDPLNGKDSIRFILKDCPGELFVCPSSPEELTKKGLTFLWNDKCSGKSLGQIKDAADTWLMIEINAVSEEAPAPHSDKYNVLYADLMTIRTQSQLPEELVRDMEERHKEAVENEDRKEE